MSYEERNECCTNRNILWNVSEPNINKDLIRLYGTCHACGNKVSKTLSCIEDCLPFNRMKNCCLSVRNQGRKPSGNCLKKSKILTNKLHKRGVPATVRELPFGAEEKLHYAVVINGRFVEELEDCLYIVDITLSQFEGEKGPKGEDLSDIPDMVIVPNESEQARKFYSCLEPKVELVGGATT